MIDRRKQPGVLFTKTEKQSGLNRQRYAELLVEQLPPDHDGRNTWLLNYGVGDEAKELRAKYSVDFLEKYQAAEEA